MIAELIERKRDGGELTRAEWRRVLHDFTEGRLPAFQMSALCMAVVFRGLTRAELEAVTTAMVESGRKFPPGSGRPRVDKHSTGGVGDKTSLLLVPLVACCDVEVPMMSGRALGHTGGTLDKVEAIPGFRSALTLEEAQKQLERIGCVMMGQTDEIAPADRELYALRDVTGTVASVPLIAASIMSKKLAESLDGLVLNVKVGSGAFIPEPQHALELARTMIAIGHAHGCQTVAVMSAMDRPLGHAAGNALEVEEAIAGLRGEGPPDLLKVTLTLGAEMLVTAGVVRDVREGVVLLEQRRADGSALQKLQQLIEAQEGNPAVVDDPALLPQAPLRAVYEVPDEGIVEEVHPRTIGRAIIELGGGRKLPGDDIDPAVGFVVTAKPGDKVERGQPVATVHARDEAGLQLGLAALGKAIVIGEEARPLPVVMHRVTVADMDPSP